MRRIHLMIALFGLTVSSTPILAAPHLKLPTSPSSHPTPPQHNTQWGHPTPTGPGYPSNMYHYGYTTPAKTGFGGQPSFGTNQHTVSGGMTHANFLNAPVTSRQLNGVGTSPLSAQFKGNGNSSGKFNNIAKSERHAQHKLEKALAELAQLASALGSGQSGDSGSGGDGPGGSSGDSGSSGGGYDGGSQSYAGPAQGGDIIPASYNSYAPPANVEPAAAQEWGMKVTQVGSGGPAAQADLRVNDIIVSAAGKRIQSFEDLTSVLASAKGPMEMVIVNGETNKLEKMNIVPANGKLGVMTVPVAVE